jgi:hypothetical protein
MVEEASALIAVCGILTTPKNAVFLTYVAKAMRPSATTFPSVFPTNPRFSHTWAILIMMSRLRISTSFLRAAMSPVFG